MNLLEKLNPPQKEAVSSDGRYMMVIAGAGSGKTRVLTHKIAHLIQNGLTTPTSFLAITFTNKAAAEMKHRIKTLLTENLSLQMPSDREIWVGTFHSISSRILRLHHREARLERSFQILDTDDQIRLIKKIITDLSITLNDGLTPASVAGFISKLKDLGIRAERFQPQNSIEKTILPIYLEYERQCEKASLVDFSELLLRSFELFSHNKSIRDHYQSLFTHILVDEFQDTNLLQYEWIKKLSEDKINITAVGDDDQSIYSWRGAVIDNINKYIRDYKATLIKLEQNYRCTAKILKLANEIIKPNGGRIDKTLWTSNGEGENIKVDVAYNEAEEASYIISEIKSYVAAGGKYQDVGILYRSNHQSRAIEEQLVSNNVPYRMFGGHKFYDRREIKECLSYIRLLHNQNDNLALDRVINVPARGVGSVSLQKIIDSAKANDTSNFSAMKALLERGEFSAKSKEALHRMVELIERYTDLIQARPTDFSTIVKDYLLEVGIYHLYKSSKDEEDQARLENIDELFNAFQGYDGMEDSLMEFLNNVALDAGDMQSDSAESVSLMTIHSSKGLEFPVVFLSGVEDGLLPHENSIYSPQQVEEERRLFYVATTRAMRHLHLTRARFRLIRGVKFERLASRFLKGVAEDIITMTRGYAIGTRDDIKRKSTIVSTTTSSPYRIGAKIRHPKFGIGVILSAADYDGEYKLQIKFSEGVKQIITGYVEMELLG